MPVRASANMAVIIAICCLIMTAAVIFAPAAMAVSVVSAASLPSATSGTGESTAEVRMPDIDQTAESVLVIETNRQRHLFEKNPQAVMNIPASSQLMTALIACERLQLNTQVTISKVAAEAAAAEESPDDVVLKSGDKYPLKYLLYRLIFYASDAAALAIAEQISSVEDQFVELMNAKAKSLSMSSTTYLNCTGEPVYDDNADMSDFAPVSLQATTVEDLAILAYQVASNQTLYGILTNPSIFIILDETNLINMQNQMADLWTRSEGVIKGVYSCFSENRTYTVTFGTANSINMIALAAGSTADMAKSDLISLYQGCRSFFVSTPLVIAGDAFTGESEQTIDGEVFGLVYKQTVYYVHPVSSPYLKDTIRYKSFGPFSRPIQRSLTVGQVIFELYDGTSIAVDVVPDRQILSSISIIDQALNALQNNRNLTVLIFISFGVLLLIFAWQILSGFTRLARLIHLIIVEKRSRR